LLLKDVGIDGRHHDVVLAVDDVECPAIFVPVRKIRNWHERSLRWHEASGINRSR
jgi:hypothetical protein